MGLGCGSCGGGLPLGMGYLMGLGDDSTDSESNNAQYTDVGTVPTDTSLPSYTCADGAVVTDSSFCAENIPSLVPSGSGSSGASPATSQALANLAAAWTKIAGQTIAPQTTITTPQGLQVQTPAGQTSALASILGGTSTALNTANISALLPWILIAGAGLLLFKAVNK